MDERSLAPEDRAKLAEADRRFNDAAAQMGLDDVKSFQAALATRRAAERAELLREGVRREAERLARRARVLRAFDATGIRDVGPE